MILRSTEITIRIIDESAPQECKSNSLDKHICHQKNVH